MKKILSLLVTMTIAASAMAKDRIQMRPQNLKDIQASAKELRAQEKQIRAFFMQLVLRKALLETVEVMKKNHFSDEEVQKVVDGEGMKTFLANLENNKAIQAKVEEYVQKIVRPGAIENHVLKQREQLAKETEEKLLLARNELRKSKVFRTQEKVFDTTEQEPLVTRVWNHLVDDLYKD